MSWNKLASAFVRSVYLFNMYTGVRALANQTRSFFLPVPRAAAIDRTTILLGETMPVRVRVHGRIPPSRHGGGRTGGMISVSLERPGIPRFVYSLLRVSSHFGCGHIELAFYEEENRLCVFAVRNMLRANLHRLGCKTFLCQLSLGTERDEIVVLDRIFEELRRQGLHAHLASPAECVNLAMTPWLIKPKARDRVASALTQKYKRIARKLEGYNCQPNKQSRADWRLKSMPP